MSHYIELINNTFVHIKFDEAIGINHDILYMFYFIINFYFTALRNGISNILMANTYCG